MNVLVYSAPQGLSSPSDTLPALRASLFPNYSVQPVSPESLASHPWYSTCVLLVLPSCTTSLSGRAVSAINSFVEQGGALLAFGVGATFTVPSPSGSCFFSQDQQHRILRLFDQKTGISIHPHFCPAVDFDETGASTVELASGEILKNFYLLGTGDFTGLEQARNVQIFARHVGDETNGRAVAIKCGVCKGRAILWNSPLDSPLTPNSVPDLDSEVVALAEETRRKCLRATLQALGLVLPAVPNHDDSRPLPQFLVSSNTQPHAVAHVLEALGAASPTSQLVDISDTFSFHTLEQTASIFQQIRGVRNESTSTREPKHIIVCPNAELPATHETPLFDLALFFESLSAARKQESILPDDDTWGHGEVLLYGEVVSSTQTMFDKNPSFLSSLPSPILSIASRQLTARGRGSNVWLATPTSLSMSLMLRSSLSTISASKLVFVQYLFALAVVEACRDPAVLGRDAGSAVRIKWPNDVYAVLGEERKKIGGILVTTSFYERDVILVIGCGLNVHHQPLIASLSDLLPPSDAHRLSIERTAAVITARFETMWRTLAEHRGSFYPFMNLYLERWLHTYQVVRLATVDPPINVCILGITPDHGLLRTIPEDKPEWTVTREDYIDLQPDGNSFDLMAGMIKTKR